MNRFLMKSKIHRATVTDADLNYQGSVTIDGDLMEAANIVENEQVQIYNVTNGTRITTYAILGERGSGQVCINGAAAHHVKPGDIVIIVTYGQFTDTESRIHQPTVVIVDSQNRKVSTAKEGRARGEVK
jgi:aspartate 1-decarboxylase